MPYSSRSRRATIAIATAAVTLAGGVAFAASGDGAPNRPPWNKRCAVEIRAHSDGSASLYCAQRSRAFGAVEADSGRVQFFMSR